MRIVINRILIQNPPFFPLFLKTEPSQCPVSIKQQNKNKKTKFRWLERIRVYQCSISFFFPTKSIQHLLFVSMIKIKCMTSLLL